ncbi:protein FAM210A-like [Pecten maximus]|uniref:protein FAM210A-like n=1 Tax=Pecten maximus TaxID=6579 RepID=UPI0014581C2F|nr:protein FAM210A-like [Pecten maximus]
MFNSARVSVHRTVQHLCRQPISRTGHVPDPGEFVRARPWIWTSLKTVTQDTRALRCPGTVVHERTRPVLVSLQLHPSDSFSKNPLTCRRSIPLFGSDHCDVNNVQMNRYQNHIISRRFSVQTQQRQKQNQNSTDESKKAQEQKGVEKPVEEGKDIEKPTEQLSLVQRFKKTYKEHGKVLIGVHLLTSCVWFGSFYGIVDSGVDIVAILENLGFSETITNPFKSSSVGNVALAYLMYKLATPARYTVTIGGTNMAIKYMRKTAKIPPLKQEDKLRSLFKEGVKDAKDQGTMKFKQSRANARAKRRTANVQRTRKMKAAGRRFISNIKSRRDRFLLKFRSSRLNRKNSKRKNGNSAKK